jgi:hypothetical protein
MPKYSKGDKVLWSWGNGDAEGKVQEVFTDRVERTIKGSKITRNADNDNPAYLVKQDGGDEAIKSESELSKSS